ncbi:MAG: hypothetical protein KA319_14390 [Ferruginibacter sp.]|nr:hypothetical protein [Ferruginibacter sp.]
MWRFLTSLIALIIFSISVTAQKNGILPLNGIKYFRGGVWAKKIEVLVNDKTLLSNAVPHNIDFDVKLIEPTGFVADAAGKFYPGIKVLLLNAKKDTLGFSPNIFGDKQMPFEKMRFKNLTATLGYTQKAKENDTVYQYITFFDTRSKNELKLEFPVVISFKPDGLLTTEYTSTASGTKGYNAAATGSIQFNTIEAYLDSTYFPKSLYYNLRSAKMLGVTLDEAKAGNFKTWLYDEDMNEVPQTKPPQQYFALLKNGSEEINVLVQIALNPTDKNNKKYTARYRWESNDGMKVIDVVNKFGW